MPKPSSLRMPAFGQTIPSSFPTWDISDDILVVAKDEKLPKYAVAAYNTAHPNATKYPNHKLQLIVPGEAGQDAKWYYQRLPGTEIVNSSVGVPNLIPEKFRRGVHHVETKRAVTRDTALPTLSGDESEAKIDYDAGGRAQQTITTEVIDVDATPLVGEQLGPFGIEGTVEALVDDGTDVATGFLVVESSVVPTGAGKSVSQTRNYPANLAAIDLVDKSVGIPILIPEKFRRGIQTVSTRTKVPPGTALPTLSGDQSEASIKQETLDRSEQTITTLVIDENTDPLLGQRTGEFGNEGTSEVVVVEGYPADSGFLVKESVVAPTGDGKAIKSTTTFPAGLASVTLDDKLIGQDDLTPAKYRRLVTHNETRSLVGSTYTFPAALTGNQTQVSLAWENIDRARLKITEEVIASGVSLSGKETDEQWGDLTIAETIVNDGTAVDEGLMVKHSTVSPLGNGKSIRITISYVAFPTLVSTDIDPKFLFKTLISKTIVAAGTEGGVSNSGNTITEVREIDKWRSLQITSVIDTDSLPDPVSMNVTRNWSFPDVLIGLKVLGTGGAAVSEGETFSLEYSWDGEVSLQITNGYRGPCNGVLERSITNGPPTYVPVITPILPSTGTAVLFGGSKGIVLSATTAKASATSRARAITIPNVMTKGLQETAPLVTDFDIPLAGGANAFGFPAGFTPPILGNIGGTYDINIPASTPTALRNKQKFIADVTVDKLRGNLYVLEVLTLEAVVGSSFILQTR